MVTTLSSLDTGTLGALLGLHKSGKKNHCHCGCFWGPLPFFLEEHRSASGSDLGSVEATWEEGHRNIASHAPPLR